MFSNCDVQIDDTGGSIYINVYTGIYTGISYQYIYTMIQYSIACTRSIIC